MLQGVAVWQAVAGFCVVDASLYMVRTCKCVAVYFSVLQCVAVCRIVSQCVAVCKCVAVCLSVSQCVAVCSSV